MSGPKVIQVEPLRAIQEREATRILHRIRDCTADVAASDLSADHKNRLQKHLQSLLNTVGQMSQNENWKGIIDHGRAQLEFVAAELERALEHEREQEAERIQQRQNAKYAVATVIKECERLKIPVPTALLEASEDTYEPAAVSELLQQIENIKVQRNQEKSTKTLKQYASEFLRGGDLPTRVRDIIQSNSIEAEEVQKITSLLKEAVKWASKDQMAVLQNSAAGIANEKNADRKELLVDSFVLLVNELKGKAEQKSRCTRLIKTMEGLLAPFSGEDVSQMLEKVNALKNTDSYQACASLQQVVETWVKAQELKLDAQARRAAVLTGLASLGYEVREGMAVGLATQGKVVVEKAAIPGYGIEVTAPANNQSMQVRVVAFRDQTDALGKLRDKEVEEKWCSEFARLRTMLQSEGFPLEVKHASAVGEHAVKAVGAKSKATEVSRKVAESKTKSL